MELVDLAPASVSEHLKVMRTAGLLVLERRGRFRYYRADSSAVAFVAEGLAALAEAGPRP